MYGDMLKFKKVRKCVQIFKEIMSLRFTQANRGKC